MFREGNTILRLCPRRSDEGHARQFPERGRRDQPIDCMDGNGSKNRGLCLFPAGPAGDRHGELIPDTGGSLRVIEHGIFKHSGVGYSPYAAGQLIGLNPVADFQQRRPDDHHINYVTDDSAELYTVADFIQFRRDDQRPSCHTDDDWRERDRPPTLVAPSTNNRRWSRWVQMPSAVNKNILAAL